MNTAMSTKRFHNVAIPMNKGKDERSSLAFFGLICGLVLLALGAMLDEPVLAAPGFFGFASALLYYNSFFWAGVMEKRHMNNKDAGESGIQ